MANNEEAAEKAAQLQGKLRTIEGYAEWLLTLKEAWFNQHRLYDAVMSGGWKADVGTEKRNMRKYLSSIAKNNAESEERREKARMLRHKIDVETEANAQVSNSLDQGSLVVHCIEEVFWQASIDRF